MLDTTPGATPEPFDNGPHLGVELQILALVQQVLMRQQMTEEASRSQEMALLRKFDDFQNSTTSNVLGGLEQTQCQIGGLYMQLMNMQAQVQALLMGQAQLQAQMAQQAVVVGAVPGRQNSKEPEVPTLPEITSQPDTKSQPQADADTPSTKRKRPGSRTRRRARSAYNSNRTVSEPLEQIEDVVSEDAASSAGIGQVANLAELENEIFDKLVHSKGEVETDNKLALPCFASEQVIFEVDADTSSCGGGSPQALRRFGSFCLEIVDNPQECLSPLMDEALFSLLGKLRNGEDNAAEECLKIIENEEFTGINAKSQGGRTALHLAVRCQHEEICRAILARPDFTEINAKYRGLTALTLAAEKKLTEICLAILDRADFSEINAKTIGCGETALHKAAAQGLIDVCCAIIEHPDLHAVNATTLPRSMGSTAAEVAEGCGHAEVAKIIRSLGGR